MNKNDSQDENRHILTNFTRKKVHFIYTAIIIGLHYLGIIIETYAVIPEGWSGKIISIWLLTAVALGYLWIMMIFDVVRLVKYDTLMPKFLRKGAANSLKRNEFILR